MQVTILQAARSEMWSSVAPYRLQQQHWQWQWPSNNTSKKQTQAVRLVAQQAASSQAQLASK